MNSRRDRFAEGTGQWRRPRTLIVSDELHRELASLRPDDDTTIVSTPLDMIMQLEANRLFTTVVLAGSTTTKRDLAAFLLEFYPSVRVVDGRRDAEPDTYLPAFG